MIGSLSWIVLPLAAVLAEPPMPSPSMMPGTLTITNFRSGLLRDGPNGPYLYQVGDTFPNTNTVFTYSFTFVPEK